MGSDSYSKAATKEWGRSRVAKDRSSSNLGASVARTIAINYTAPVLKDSASILTASANYFESLMANAGAGEVALHSEVLVPTFGSEMTSQMPGSARSLPPP